MATQSQPSSKTAIRYFVIEWSVPGEQCTVYARSRASRRQLGSFTSREELLSGKAFLSLTDGGTLHVQMQGADLQVTRNGEPLQPIPPPDEEVIGEYIKSHYGISIFTARRSGAETVGVIGGCSILAAILLFFLSGVVGFMALPGLDSTPNLAITLGLGALFIGLAVLVSRGSITALIIAFVVYLIDSIVFILGIIVLLSLNPGSSLNVSGLFPGFFLRFIFLYYMGLSIVRMRKAPQAIAEAEAEAENTRSRLLCFQA